MSLDIKYRPRIYSDVLGQESTIQILKEFVRSGRGFQQSYLFCGGHGSGKTTLGRIMARALLCDAPVDGEPCDLCHSCKAFLDQGGSADFVEFDAATNSGKADIKAITDEIAYSTFSGKRRLYLFDESHQLSKDALDALLKYLEDTFPGSEDKKLTCIFCTTEPEKMRATILSRCAPAFMVQAQKPAQIASRLATICEKEGIPADPEMLTLIAEVTECHIRDALKAVEGVSMLGAINRENVTAYLHLDLNTTYIEVLQHLGTNLPECIRLAKDLMQQVSPVTCYAKLTEVAMLAFQVSLGETSGTGFWNQVALQSLAAKGPLLLGYAARFASRPGRPTAAMLQMDLATLHMGATDVRSSGVTIQVQTKASPSVVAPQPLPQVQVSTPQAQVPAEKIAPTSNKPAVVGVLVSERDRDWVIDPMLINHPVGSRETVARRSSLTRTEFATLLGKMLAEKSRRGGSA